MGSMTLVGGASTQSRGRRPLPPGAVEARTTGVSGVYEWVDFYYPDVVRKNQRLLSWIGGQAGLLFGAIPDTFDFPEIFDSVIDGNFLVHGSYGHATEYALADALGEVYDGHLTSADMMCRFFQSGGEACAAAVRIARAEIGRDLIASSGYHGAATDFAHEPYWLGYPKANLDLHRRFEFGDVVEMRRQSKRSACVMVEAPAWDDEEAIVSFLIACRETADEFGIPFIIDDVVGGFRFALGGTCERYGVKADMVCLGKAISATGGVSALVGRADLIGRLGEDVFYSTTFGGNPGPCSVAAATVRWLTEHRAEVYGSDGHLQTIGRALKDGLNALGVRCVGQPERSIAVFDMEEERRGWCSKMIERGVMVDRPFFPTLAHTLDDVRVTLKAAEAIREH